MLIYYRISDSSYNKQRTPYITKVNCLQNFIKTLREADELHIITDNVTEETYNMVCKVAPNATIHRTSFGHGALSFYFTTELAVSKQTSNDTICYFVEDDYLHKKNALNVIEDGINLGFDYITGYDHPDKYMNPEEGGNPFCEGRSELTRVYLGKLSHFKITNGTTMTFAVRKSTLIDDLEIISKYTQSKHEQSYPYDFYMFMDLCNLKKRTLGSSIPGVSTHGETRWLSPLTVWSLEV